MDNRDLDIMDDFDEHDHDHDEDMEIIYLNLEDGSELECGIIGVFEVEDNDYMALWAVDEDEVLLFRYEELEEEFELTSIDDEEEFDLVSQAYYALFVEDELDDYEDYDDDYDEYDEYDSYDEDEE